MPDKEGNTRGSSKKGNHHLDTKNKNCSKKNFSSVSELIELRNKHPNNPIIGYLNMNSLKNKIMGLRETASKAPLDIVCIDEKFPPFQEDGNSKGGGKLVFVENGLTGKRVK